MSPPEYPSSSNPKDTREDIRAVFFDAIKAYNSSCETGRCRPYEIIPFSGQTGEDEFPSDHDLPELTNVDRISALDDNQVRTYLEKYGIKDISRRDRRPSPVARHVRERLLRRYLGCAVEL